jgi:hypothetical protein
MHRGGAPQRADADLRQADMADMASLDHFSDTPSIFAVRSNDGHETWF